MKQIVYPSKTPKYIGNSINEAIELAYGFMCAKYGYRYNNVVLVFQPTACRSRFFRNDFYKHKVYGKTPVVSIAMRSELLLYTKKSLGKYNECVNVGYTLQMASALVHELTHLIQFLEGRNSSELETTANELEFFKVVSPDWYKRIMINSPLQRS